MGFISIKKDEAKYAHQDFYKGSFEVIPMKRSGFYDFPPFSFVYGISDIGSWDGLISTNGKKVVVTKSAYTDLSKVVKKFEFDVSEIENKKIGVFKTTLTLKNKISGLTKGSILKSILIFPGIFFFIPAFFVFFLPSKIFQFRLNNDFGNIEKFKALLK
jgi:hypothetical protein